MVQIVKKYCSQLQGMEQQNISLFEAIESLNSQGLSEKETIVLELIRESAYELMNEADSPTV